MSNIQELPGLRLHLKSLQSVRNNLAKKLDKQNAAAEETEALLSQTDSKVDELAAEIKELEDEAKAIQANNVPSGFNVNSETPQTYA